MSRIGKLPITVPNDIKVELDKNIIKISKGAVTKEYDFGDKIAVVFKDGVIKLAPVDGVDKAEVNNLYGLHRNNIANIVNGLSDHFKVTLEINGVGFKAVVLKNILILTLGYSHDIAFALPAEVGAKVEENRITLDSYDKQLVGQVASEIISLRKPEPYKGKGVKIFDKPILRKEGKKK